MINEKDSIRIILEGRGIINNGLFDEIRFRKFVTEPWLYSKTIKYGFDKMNEKDKQVPDNEPVIEEAVEIQEPITALEEVVEPNDMVETSTESVLLEEDLKEEIEEPIVEEPVVAEEVPTEEPVVDECPLYEEAPVVVEEPIVEAVEEAVVEEVVETPKKKTSKKK